MGRDKVVFFTLCTHAAELKRSMRCRLIQELQFSDKDNFAISLGSEQELKILPKRKIRVAVLTGNVKNKLWARRPITASGVPLWAFEHATECVMISSRVSTFEELTGIARQISDCYRDVEPLKAKVKKRGFQKPLLFLKRDRRVSDDKVKARNRRGPLIA